LQFPRAILRNIKLAPIKTLRYSAERCKGIRGSGGVRFEGAPEIMQTNLLKYVRADVELVRKEQLAPLNEAIRVETKNTVVRQRGEHFSLVIGLLWRYFKKLKVLHVNLANVVACF
jgi:hypothetical protein